VVTIVEVACEICGLSARMKSPDDIAYMEAHEEYHRSRGELPP